MTEHDRISVIFGHAFPYKQRNFVVYAPKERGKRAAAESGLSAGPTPKTGGTLRSVAHTGPTPKTGGKRRLPPVTVSRTPDQPPAWGTQGHRPGPDVCPEGHPQPGGTLVPVFRWSAHPHDGGKLGGTGARQPGTTPAKGETFALPRLFLKGHPLRGTRLPPPWGITCR